MDGEHVMSDTPDATDMEAAVAAGNCTAVISILERRRKECELLREEREKACRERDEKYAEFVEAERRHAEELRRRESVYRTIAENSPDGIIRLDRDYRIIYANPAAAEMMRTSREDLLGKTPIEFPMPVHLASLWQGGLQRVLENGRQETFEYEFDDQRTIHYLQITMTPEFDPDEAIESVLAITRDISGQKKTEVALRESEQRFRLALGASPIIVYAQNGSFQYTWIYSSHPEFSAEKLLGRTDLDMYPADVANRMSAVKGRVMQTGQPERAEFEAATERDTRRLDVTIAPLRNNEGQIIGITGVVLDITARKRAEETVQKSLADLHAQSEQLREVNEALILSSVRRHEFAETAEKLTTRLQLLLNALPVGVMIAEDPECRNITTNQAGSRMFEVPEGGNISAPALAAPRYFHQGRELTTEEMPLLAAVFGNRNVRDLEIEVVLPSGHHWTGLFNATPLHDQKGKVVGGIAVALDVTERRELEESIARLRREQEAFLRHEMKNLFVPLQLFSEILLLDAGNLSEEQIQYLSRIAEGAKRAIEFIDALKTIHDLEGGTYPLRRAYHPLNGILRQVVNDLKLTAERAGVTIHFNAPEEDALMLLDMHLMPGVFTNLILNAIEHVAGLRDPEEKVVTVDLTKERNRYIVRIKNRGAPIPSERLATFFDKYNVGPEKKHGTGLGTTYAYLVTKAQGYEITVDSTAKEGTTVTLVFQRDEAPAIPPRP